MNHPLRYGFAAGHQFGGKYKSWNLELENELRSEWEQGAAANPWAEVRAFVQKGFEQGCG